MAHWGVSVVKWYFHEVKFFFCNVGNLFKVRSFLAVGEFVVGWELLLR